MSATNFKTVNQTFRQLIGNGLSYCIPHFQRDYSWTDQEWDDLWQDVMATLQADGDVHYMGYLVLQSDDDKIFQIIDGQQRMTTLSIFVLAALKNLKKLIEQQQDANHNQQRLDQLLGTYIGYLDPVTLQSKPKLTLNRHNDFFYRTYLVALADQLPQRNLRASEHGLRKAFEWYERKIAQYLKSATIQEHGIVLAKMISDMSDKLFFTAITVSDDLNAYKVFETLNARGVRLSATDLLKNYLFSVLYKQCSSQNAEDELKNLEEKWERMVSRLGGESLPDFLRVHWNSRYQFVRQSDLFKRVREKITDRAGIFKLLREMDEDIDVYLSLTSPSSATQWPLPVRKYAEQLRMFSVRQPYALLMVAARRLHLVDFEKLLRGCVVISFRYNVIGGMRTGDQEAAYHAATLFIHQHEKITAHDILLQLRDIYVADDIFKAEFSDKSIKTTAPRNKKMVRYILTELEIKSAAHQPDMHDDYYNIEHIFPQNAEAGWHVFSEREGVEMLYRLGNMTLCEAHLNKNMENHAFLDKKEFLLQSNIELTRRIAQCTDWTPEQVAHRQQWMAKQATSIWRIDGL